MTETTHVKMTTRRKLLTRDIKAICAMAVVPVAAQVIFPAAASAAGRPEGWDGPEARPGYGQGGGCFLKGTRILTATGERKIEDLAPGDLVQTAFGGTRPVESIGSFRRLRSDTSKPWAKHARPVRVARSALGPEVPHRDLYVTQGHALLFDDVLIPAGSLINGTTITLDAADEHDDLEFFHLKLETHDAIYAEGAPCETLLSVDSSMSNFPDTTRQPQTSGARDLHCAPIICNGMRGELKIRLRSLMSPWLGPQKFDEIRTGLELRALSLGVA